MKYMIKTKSIIIFFTLLCTFVPMSFYYIPMGTLIIRVLRVLRTLILVYYIIDIVKYGFVAKRLSKFFLFIGFLLVSTINHGGGITNYLENTSIILTIFLLAEKYIYRCDENEKYLSLKYVYYYFLFMMIINMASMLILPQGVYRVVYEKDFWHELSYPVYFLNTENRLIEYTMPLLLLSAIMYEKKMIKKVSFIISIIIVIFTTIKAMSLTSITGILVVIIIYIISRKRNVTSRVYIFYPLVFLMQIFFELVMTSTGLLAVLDFLFGRVNTIQSRYLLSKQALKVIPQNMLFGVGTAKSGRLFTEGNMVYWVHNHALDILVQSGIIGFILFINNLIKSDINSKYSLSNVQKIVFSGMIAMLIMGMSESFFYSVEFYLVLSLTDI